MERLGWPMRIADIVFLKRKCGSRKGNARCEDRDEGLWCEENERRAEMQERGARRAPPICFLYRPLPPIARSLSSAKIEIAG
jgi:hypothetical protein